MCNNVETDKISKLRSWESRKELLADSCYKNNVKSRYAFKGSIYMTWLGENIGNEINKKRPAIVISNNKYNIRSQNVIVLPLTKKMLFRSKNSTIPKYSYHYFLYMNKYDFLNFDSCVECEQIRTVSKSRISYHLGDISSEDLNNIIKKLNNFIIEK